MAVIRIKTAEEFRDAHVTIEIVADDQAEAGEVCERLTSETRMNLKTRVAELERDARVTAVTTDSLRRQLADETKRADKWGLKVAKNSAPDGIYARAQHLESQLDQREQAVRELRELIVQRDNELARAADNFKISQDKNRDLKAELDQVRSDRDIQKKERTANREWAERAEKDLASARVKLKKISKAVNDGLTISTQKVEEIREILDEA